MCVCICVLSHVQLFATLQTAAHQAPLSMEYSRQEHWSGLPFPPPGDLPNPGTELVSPALVGGFFTTGATWKAPYTYIINDNLNCVENLSNMEGYKDESKNHPNSASF